MQRTSRPTAMDPDTAHASTPPSSIDQFISSLNDRGDADPLISARRFAVALHIDMPTLAQLAGVDRNAVRSERMQRFLQDAIKVIQAAADVSGDVQRALFWYRNEPLSPFDDKTAEQLVSDGRTGDLLRYISALREGAAG